MANSEPKGSFARWQAVAISQMTYSVNLVLGFAIATLGFQVTLLLNDSFLPVAWQKCVYAMSILLLAASIALGVFIVVNRLRDFRATKTAARLQEEGVSDLLIEPYRILYRKLGTRTWGIFWWQLGTFTTGVMLTAIAILGVVWHKFS